MNELASAGAVTADQLMSTPVVAVTVDHSLAAAWEAMRQRGVHHLAVLDDSGIAAVLDDRTVAAQWPAGGHDSAHPRRVGDVLGWGVRCVLPTTPAAVVARVMVDGGCDAVPVVTESGALIGLVTSADLVAALAGTWVGAGAAGSTAWDIDGVGR